MRADQVVTVSMTETVTHELTLTAERLAEITGIGLDQLDSFLADHTNWTGLAGPHGEAVECLLDVIDCDLPRERTLDIRESPEFQRIAHRVREGLMEGHSYDD